MKSKKHDFDLEKWYLDCVTETGDVLIGYVAILKWKNFKVPYSSSIFMDKAGSVQVATRMIRPRWPILQEGEVTWEDTRLKINGHWESVSEPIEARIHNSENGSLIWSCYQPKSNTRISYKGKFLAGFGYAEKLRLTDLPWNIDMQTLRWGRFNSNKYNLVWIQLSGAENKFWLWNNGSSVEDAVINDSQIEISRENLVLRLDQSGIIESEQKIFNTVKALIKHLPGFDKIIPPRFLHADETKWRSRGQLFINDKLITEGWSIHELVDFN